MGAISKWRKLTEGGKTWEYWVGIIGIILTAAIVVAVVFYWDRLQGLGNYGYIGAFLISIVGGATIIAPIPMTPVVFTLGAVTKPVFAPFLGPIFIGIAAGMGETIGGVAIYMMGYGGAAAIMDRKYGRLQKLYEWLMGWMQRRGSLVLFILSAVLNPFFYPAAIAAGALRFNVQRYVLVCMAGKIIKGISVAAAGYWGLGSLLRMFGVPI